MKILTLNGVDGVGKSQQRRLIEYYLNHKLCFSQSMMRFFLDDTEMSETDLFDWWFFESSIEDFSSWMAKALQKRFESLHNFPDEAIVLHERGTSMWMAVCMATYSLKNKSLSIDDRYEISRQTFSEYAFYHKPEVDLFLKKDTHYANSILELISLSELRESIQSERTSKRDSQYEAYQNYLRNAIDYIIEKRECATLYVDQPIVPTHQNVRNWIEKEINYEFDYALIRNEQLRIYGFSGLTESGKSSHAQALSKRLNGYRLKLAFFDYTINSSARLLTREEYTALSLLDFFNAHYFVNSFTVESIHSARLSAVLKLFFGPRFKLIHMECPREIRVTRAMAVHSVNNARANNLIEIKDNQKGIEAAAHNRVLADFVLDSGVGRPVHTAVYSIPT